MTEQSRAKLNKFSVWLSVAALIFSIALFWAGMSFLKAEVFPHYFNPQKHQIVKQNPDTKEVYAWQDASGAVYTPEDTQVKNFTWGITALLLFVMLSGMALYNKATKYYTGVLLAREPARSNQNYVPRLQ
ncbi:hypothetical protein SAMN05660649_02427 [Desulfotomaculum arcticum]|uniref:Uncharacterized protein n=1 Tax=Desulfotruncus arcticus DSM 17038 TaxID=1121424 RepID=A0A1I2TZQ1_9FIRM|nr:hypothetical protein [Desulfotruncus arcticus]SFG70372.1 hypothetical protein SAMN05660649_02427 [Desulfotomaculum arcticum] [Desulfotruncus arcticus DSM 17038]